MARVPYAPGARFRRPLAVEARAGWTQRTEKKAGFKKIVEFCSISKQNGYKWAWVDTCCIDKSSSAELSEAINSMFHWYARSDSCYAYLSDVCDNDYERIKEIMDESSWIRDTSSFSSPLENYEGCEFISSRWFRRGWTLQELLAPSKVCFFDTNWQLIGQRGQLSKVIQSITKIPSRVLRYRHFITMRDRNYISRLGYSVAQKISWASSRVTTRAEDTAYCLLGLFDINMPLLYGEGREKAFRRLQEEIIRTSTDHSIFAWSLSVEDSSDLIDDTLGPILAASPTAFARAANIAGIPDHEAQDRYTGHKMSYSITNYGLHIELPLLPCPGCPGLWNRNPEERCYLALLNCFIQGEPHQRIGISLGQERSGRFERAHCNYISTKETDDATSAIPNNREIYIRAHGIIYDEHD